MPGALTTSDLYIFRFTEGDDVVAAGYVERATRLDPNFAGAFAALSFTSHQAAAMRHAPGWGRVIDRAQVQAERSLELDPLDPFANLSRGRLQLLLGRPEYGPPWLDQSVQLSSGYAKGHYSRGFAAMLSDRTSNRLADIDTAMELSLLDPMLCAMRSCKGVAFPVEGDRQKAL